MRFDRIALENFKCYGDAELALEPGVTVIHGPNGSGKSSLLEACFFALYGARALEGTLEDVVTNGEERTRVVLSFTHGGAGFRVEREVTLRSSGAETTTCVLETPDGEVDGATDVRHRVSELLRMDEHAFVNCAYVRQGEVNKLIHATPAERQDVIDDLLQLGTLEEYRERAGDARLGIEDVLTGVRSNVEQLDEQIEAKEQRDLPGRLNELETELGEVEAEIERYEDNQASAEETLADAEAVLEEHAERRAELEDLEDEIEALQDGIASTEREREEIATEIGEHREAIEQRREERADVLAETDLDAGAGPEAVADRIEEIEAEREDLATALGDLRVAKTEAQGEAESLADEAEDLAERAADEREEAAELEAEIEQRESDLADRRADVADLEDEIEAERAAFEDAPVAFGAAEDHLASLAAEREALTEEINEVQVDVERLRERIEEAEALLDAGKCPTCGQPVEDSPHVHDLDEDRETLAAREEALASLRADREDLDEDIEAAESLVAAREEVAGLRERRATVETLIEDREEAVAEQRERVAGLREQADDLEADAEERRADAAAARERVADLAERIDEREADLRELDDALDRLERVRDLDDAIADREDEIGTLRERRESKADLNDERRDRLAEKRERRDALAEAVDADRVAAARDDKERAEDYLEQVAEQLAELRERHDDLQAEIGGVQAELNELAELRERREDRLDELERLESLHGEAEQLEAAYGDLRAELRQRNVASLERMLNDSFDRVYRNDSYARIELSGDYELTVYQKDGEPLDPEQLSGGERALFNLSLRTAIYRLLAEGIEGAAPMPPLILDEPTVFLDAGHVTRLLDLVEHMRDEVGVAQILVVSHDEELVGAADDLVRVRKDPTTNRSSVEHVERVAPDAIATGDD